MTELVSFCFSFRSLTSRTETSTIPAWACFHLHLYGHFLVVTFDLEDQLFARFGLSHALPERVKAFYLLTVHLRHNVADFQVCLERRTAFFDPLQLAAVRMIDAPGADKGARARPPTAPVLALHQSVPGSPIGSNGDVKISSSRIADAAMDANDAAMHVEQRSA